MRGYFGLGVEGISKSMNVGNLQRSAHAFGASFFFTVDSVLKDSEIRQSDTSGATEHMPVYVYSSLDELQLPKACKLIGVELTEESVELPSFRHPTAAAYILGPERASLSPKTIERCDAVVKIPMKFCVNVGIAGAIVMYDRLISMGRFDERPVTFSGETQPLQPHVHGQPRLRKNPLS
ncbi:RNA methyltransferase [Rhodovibrionaceae bacterium A322]